MIDKKATIHDVAKLAETSATTVSRVLSDNYPVKKELKEKVMLAVQALNYTPNKSAQNLKKKSTRSIGVIVPNITNMFYSFAVLGMEEEANSNGYSMLLCNTMRDPEKEKMYVQALYENQVDGIILSSISNDSEYINKFIDRGVEFVLLDQKVQGVNNSSYIGFDVRAGAVKAVKHLVSMGHEKIAIASSPLTIWTRKELFQGYKDGLSQSGVTINEEYFLIASDEVVKEEEGYEVALGKALASEFVEKNIDATAILAVNDMTAFGLIKGLEAGGKRVPKDVSVIGFDDIPFASLFSPALTTVSYPPNEAGKLAAKVLFENLNGNSGFNLNLKLEPKLIIRDSVKSI